MYNWSIFDVVKVMSVVSASIDGRVVQYVLPAVYVAYQWQKLLLDGFPHVFLT